MTSQPLKRVVLLHDGDGDWSLMVEEGAPVQVYWVDEAEDDPANQVRPFTLRASASAIDGLMPKGKE